MSFSDERAAISNLELENLWVEGRRIKNIAEMSPDEVGENWQIEIVMLSLCSKM